MPISVVAEAISRCSSTKLAQVVAEVGGLLGMMHDAGDLDHVHGVDHGR